MELMQGINIPTFKGTDHIPPTMYKDMGYISTDDNYMAIPTMTEAAVSEGMHCTPHPATTAVCVALWLMDAPNTICTMTYPTGIVAPLSTFTTSPADISHTTILQSRACPAPTTPTALHRKQPIRKTMPHPRPSTHHKSHVFKIVIIHDSLSDSSSDSESNSDPLNY